ncbi:hypothetical protein IAU60_002195 [Kwoniella sp. DSM 27419]
MSFHGLLAAHQPPSRELLLGWLDAQGIVRDERLTIADMENGQGWALVATDDMDIGELISSIPKSAILSYQTSALPPLDEELTKLLQSVSMNSYTILHLSLCLLHEFRLAEESRFYGYIQSLPRETVGIPLLWGIEEICGDDGRLGARWLKGTEVEQELEARAMTGLALSDLKDFYNATCAHLPPTSSHPDPSPFIAYLHAFSLVSTRAFLIDLYHLIALCPFSDILNHSSDPHTSLAADDFVCHICGSLKSCPHDICTKDDEIPYRLWHLGQRERDRIEREDDTVDMRVERPVAKGEEVWNSYGEGLSDARLLVEWGFVAEEFTGDGMTWDIDDLRLNLDFEGGGREDAQDDSLEEAWWSVVEGATADLDLGQDEEDGLLCPPSERDSRLLNLDHSARVSVNTFAWLWLDEAGSELPTASARATTTAQLVDAVAELEQAWQNLEGEEADRSTLKLDESIQAVARRIRGLLADRLSSMYRAELTDDELFGLRDDLRPEHRYQYMAMTLSINERILLRSAIQKWDAIL